MVETTVMQEAEAIADVSPALDFITKDAGCGHPLHGG